jgi:hypothetical protein
MITDYREKIDTLFVEELGYKFTGESLTWENTDNWVVDELFVTIICYIGDL